MTKFPETDILSIPGITWSNVTYKTEYNMNFFFPFFSFLPFVTLSVCSTCLSFLPSFPSFHKLGGGQGMGVWRAELWTIKLRWQEGARRNVQNIVVIYEHVANRCGGVTGTLISFYKCKSHLCLSYNTTTPRFIICFIKILCRAYGWLIIVDDRNLLWVSCVVKDKHNRAILTSVYYAY